jgi:hypothetical protein
MDEMDEWLERNIVMTEAEREQCERAMEAFRKTLGKSSPHHPFTCPDWYYIEPIDDETLDELMGDYCC